MPGERIGANLFMCIPPDHMRDDLPSEVTVADVSKVHYADMALQSPDVRMVYVGITDDMGNTVTLPCFKIERQEGKLILMAHRTGRPNKIVVDMPSRRRSHDSR